MTVLRNEWRWFSAGFFTGLALVGLLLVLLAASAQAATVRLTYYLPTGNLTASGIYPYPGSAACSYNYPLGTVLSLPDRTVTCLDRGQLGPSHVDVFVTSYVEGRALIASLGDYTDAEVISWGW